MSDSSKKSNGDDHSPITSSELSYILDVNKRAIELYIEVERQNELVLSKIDEVKQSIDNANSGALEAIKDLKPRVEEIDKHLFRLLVFLGFLGGGVIYQIISAFFHK